MRTRVLCVTSLFILWVATGATAATLTPEQMYWDPATVPADYYQYASHEPGYVLSFADVTALQVLPVVTDSGDYYFTPGVDYVGDITGGDGSITFGRSGPYLVQATFAGGATQIVDVGIDLRGYQPPAAPVTVWKPLPTPDGGDITVWDPSIGDPPPQVSGGATVVGGKATWAQVTAYLTSDAVKGKHVELLGHGGPGEFYWNGAKVLDSSSTAFFDSLKGHVNCLTFISCSTGSGAEGDTFLRVIAQRIGTAGAYTTDLKEADLSKAAHTWYIEDNGVFKMVPEPLTMLGVLLGFSGLSTYVRKRLAA